MICTFFGHRDAPDDIRPLLAKTIKEVSERADNVTFYVGNNGKFDSMALSELKKISADVTVVLAYLPENNAHNYDVPSIYPEGLETVPRRFAIDRRNKWLAEHSDVVIAYVSRSFGGAAKFSAYAAENGREVINLAKL